MANVVWFRDIRKNDIGIVGGKGANLGEMVNSNFPIPPGFVVTAQAYFKFLEEGGIKEKIVGIADSADVDSTADLAAKTREIRQIILGTPMPKDIEIEIKKNYAKLGSNRIGWLTSSEDIYVAIRSSATAEDLPEASFAGQQETYLNVVGKDTVVETVQKCWASLFTERATYYRKKNNFPTSQVGIAVVVQKMVNSESSGVMFTADPTGDTTKIIIEAAYGLGEVVVGGQITPDHYELNNKFKIMEKKLAEQEWMLIRAGKGNKKEDVPRQKKGKQKISDKHIIELGKIGKQIEGHYKAPQDIEWAFENDALYIVQSRAITTMSLSEKMKGMGAEADAPVLVNGLAASPGSASAKVSVVPETADIAKVQKGDILVTKMTSPDWVPIMKRSSAIVTDEGGLTCHAAIVSRELGIPCIVGSGNATKRLEDGKVVTVDGYRGNVYEGEVRIEGPARGEEIEVIKDEEVEELEDALEEEVEEEHIELPKEVHHPKEGVPLEEEKEYVEDLLEAVSTKVKVNVALPAAAEKAAETNADGVGLLRAEHMMTAKGEHPAEYIRQDDDEGLVNAVKEGIRTVAEKFKGKPVWYRTFDARTDEFRQLKGGENEPEEDNPMLGWHGIRRDLDQPRLLKGQLKAIKELREEGLTNVGVMIPFTQHPSEFRNAKELAKEVGLEPESKDFEMGVMVETPASVWAIDEYIDEGIDFISFGTNDLTQLTLGVDRNNEHIQKLFTELHPAIIRELEHVIKKCRKAGVKTSICGQAASNPEMVRKLVRFGISSVSANIDAVEKIKDVVLLEEKNIIMEKHAEREQ